MKSYQYSNLKATTSIYLIVRIDIKKQYKFNVLHLTTDKNIKMFRHNFVVNENAVPNYKIIKKYVEIRLNKRTQNAVYIIILNI